MSDASWSMLPEPGGLPASIAAPDPHTDAIRQRLTALAQRAGIDPPSPDEIQALAERTRRVTSQPDPTPMGQFPTGTTYAEDQSPGRKLMLPRPSDAPLSDDQRANLERLTTEGDSLMERAKLSFPFRGKNSPEVQAELEQIYGPGAVIPQYEPGTQRITNFVIRDPVTGKSRLYDQPSQLLNPATWEAADVADAGSVVAEAGVAGAGAVIGGALGNAPGAFLGGTLGAVFGNAGKQYVGSQIAPLEDVAPGSRVVEGAVTAVSELVGPTVVRSARRAIPSRYDSPGQYFPVNRAAQLQPNERQMAAYTEGMTEALGDPQTAERLAAAEDVFGREVLTPAEVTGDPRLQAYQRGLESLGAETDPRKLAKRKNAGYEAVPDNSFSGRKDSLVQELGQKIEQKLENFGRGRGTSPQAFGEDLARDAEKYLDTLKSARATRFNLGLEAAAEASGNAPVIPLNNLKAALKELAGEDVAEFSLRSPKTQPGRVSSLLDRQGRPVQAPDTVLATEKSKGPLNQYATELLKEYAPRDKVDALGMQKILADFRNKRFDALGLKDSKPLDAFNAKVEAALQKDLDAAIQQRVPGAQELKAARDGYREISEAMRQDRVRLVEKALRNAVDGREGLTADTMVNSLRPEEARKLVPIMEKMAPELLPQARGMFLEKALDASYDAAGEFDPRKFRAFFSGSPANRRRYKALEVLFEGDPQGLKTLKNFLTTADTLVGREGFSARQGRMSAGTNRLLSGLFSNVLPGKGAVPIVGGVLEFVANKKRLNANKMMLDLWTNPEKRRVLADLYNRTYNFYYSSPTLNFGQAGGIDAFQQALANEIEGMFDETEMTDSTVVNRRPASVQ